MNARLYRALSRIRRVEEEIVRIYPTDRIKSPVHLSIGQEAVSVGVCDALRPQDVVFGTYRSHALYLARGCDLAGMMAELYGKADGCTRGRGGSMHLMEPERGLMLTSAVVATTIPIALGYAYAMKLRQRDVLAAVFFGDGATEEGVFCETLNFAALKSLPVLFVCENNFYAIHTHQSKRQANSSLCDRVRAFGVEAERIEGNDVFAIRERTEAFVRSRSRGEGGPLFIECMTYRWKEHVGPNDDYQLGYRTREEAEKWITDDQVARLAALVPADERRSIEEQVEAEIQSAIAFAENSPFPSPAELLDHVYAE